MAPKEVSATHAARQLGDLLARVRYRGEAFLIRRGSTVVAWLGPAPSAGRTGAELAALWRARPALGSTEGRAFATNVERGRKRANKPPADPWAG